MSFIQTTPGIVPSTSDARRLAAALSKVVAYMKRDPLKSAPEDALFVEEALMVVAQVIANRSYDELDAAELAFAERIGLFELVADDR